jgi:hypothetical protein
MSDQLYQVWAKDKRTGDLVPMPMFPRVIKQVADHFVSVVKEQIAKGNCKDYEDPQALMHIKITH